MQRSLLLIVFLCSCLASCSTITAPPAANQPVEDYSGYFWAASDSSYIYAAPDGEHHILVSASGSVTDKNVTSGSIHSFTYTSANGGYALTGIEQSLLLAMNGGERLVKDAVGHQNSAVAVRQIFSITTKMGDSIFVVDDANIFAYETRNGVDTFVSARKIPFAGASYMLGNAILPGSALIYAYSINSSKVSYSVDHGYSWTPIITPTGSSVTALLPGNNPGQILAGLSLGNRYFLGTFDPSNGWSTDHDVQARITAIWPATDGGGDHATLGLADGTILLGRGPDHTISVDGVPVGFWQELFDNTLYIATNKQLVGHDDHQPNRLIYNRGIQKLLGSPQIGPPILYVATVDGYVARITPQGSPSYQELIINANTPVISLTGKGTAAFALSNGQVFQTNFSTKRQLTPTIPSAKTFDPGTFQLFASSADSITAGYVLQSNSQVTPYTARFIEHGSRIVLDSVSYNDIVVMQYAVINGGVVDNSKLPSYQMIFASGLGPIRIEKTYVPSGSAIPKTDTTRFLGKAR